MRHARVLPVVALLLATATAVPAPAQSFDTDQRAMAEALVAGDLAAARTAIARLERHLAAGLPPDGPDEAVLLGGMGQVLQSLGDTEAAIGFYARAADAAARIHGPDAPLRLEALHFLLGAYVETGRNAEIIALGQELAPRLASLLGPDATEVWQMELSVALALGETGRKEEAQPLLAALHARLSEAFGPGSEAANLAGRALARNLADTGRVEDAIPLLSTLSAASEAAAGPDAEATLYTRLDLGDLLIESGDLDAARPILEGVLARIEPGYPPGHLFVQRAKSGLARIHKAQDRYFAFRRLNEEVMQGEMADGTPPDRRLDGLLAFASQAQASARFDAYADTLREIVALVDAHPELPQVHAGEALRQLGELAYLQGDDVAAQAHLTEALGRLTALAGPEALETLRVRAQIAFMRRKDAGLADTLARIGRAPVFGTGDPARDAVVTEDDIAVSRMLAEAEEAADPTRLKSGIAWINHAGVLSQAGRHDAALEIIDTQMAQVRFRAAALALVNPMASEAVRILQGQFLRQAHGDILARAGRHDEAVETYARGLDDVLLFLRWSAPLSAMGVTGMVQTSAHLYADTFAKTAWEAAAASPADAPDHLRAGFRAAQVAGFDAAARAVSRSAARTAAEDPALLADISRWEDLSFGRVMAARAVPGGGPDRDDAIELARLEAAIEARLPGFFETHVPEPVDLAALRPGADGAGLLGPDEALVLILPPTAVGFGTPRDHGLVFAVTREGSAWAELPLSTEDLSLAIARLHQSLDPEDRGASVLAALRAPMPPSGETAPAAAPPPFAFETSQALHDAFFGDPAIAALIADKPSWLIVPQGVTMSTPFAALVSEQPAAPAGSLAALREAAWLGHARGLTVLPSVSALRSLRAAPAPSAPDTRLAYVGLGDPDFTGEAGAEVQTADALFRSGPNRAAAIRALPRLPGTRREVEALAALFDPAGSALLLGPAASEANLRGLAATGRLANARILHFATHGLVSGAFEDLSEPALALSPGDGTATPENDGLLTATEAARLGLGAEWVILSACDTGDGLALGGDGLGGLVQGFLNAGARSLMVTHWRVDDTAAARLTTETVQAHDGGLAKPEALRRAMVALASDPSRDGSPVPYAHPALWAPFFLIGDSQ